MTLPGIEPATLWVVAYSLTHLRPHVPLTVAYTRVYVTDRTVRTEILN